MLTWLPPSQRALNCCGSQDWRTPNGLVRATLEHRFRLSLEGVQRTRVEQLGGKCVQAMIPARSELAILLKCAAYNAKRLVWLVANDSMPGTT